ncbi:MAG: DTW domain-containing protein [Gammaproteobacteria bacterium]|nr:MAG: DTW domain-containing protein [Gammaproteobacteria bacterium]
MKIYLLTHERELQRKTNTGQLALDVLGPMVERVTWARREPSPVLLDLINAHPPALMYPEAGAQYSALEQFDDIVLIDSTWQEANKIYNRSAYLHALPKVTIENTSPSIYRLRRNQPEGGLCTAECIVELLRLKGLFSEADALLQAFGTFNQ